MILGDFLEDDQSQARSQRHEELARRSFGNNWDPRMLEDGFGVIRDLERSRDMEIELFEIRDALQPGKVQMYGAAEGGRAWI